MWSQIKVLRPRQAARPFLTLELFTSGQQLGCSGPVKPRCRKVPPQNSVIGAAADEGSEEVLYCWVSQFLVRELGALVQQGSDAGQQGLLISLICCPHLPNDTIFEEALFFRVSFLPSAPRDFPSE